MTTDNQKPVKQLGVDVQHDVAEAFKGKLYAYVPVLAGEGAALGVAVANEQGYSPVPIFHYMVGSYDEAEREADRLNEKLGMSEDIALRVILTTMKMGTSV